MDTVRLASVIYRYYGKNLKDGQTLRDYKPSNEKYLNIKNEVKSKKGWLKTNKDTTSDGEHENYIIKETWRNMNNTEEESTRSNLEINISKRIRYTREFIPEKDNYRIEKYWVSVSFEVQDSVMY